MTAPPSQARVQSLEIRFVQRLVSDPRVRKVQQGRVGELRPPRWPSQTVAGL